MSINGFNPYKVFSFLVKQQCKKSIMILGVSSEKNTKNTKHSQALELLELLEERKIKVQSFDPYIDAPIELKTAGPHHWSDEVNIDVVNYLFKSIDTHIFIGCPHDYIKAITFNKKATIIDLWGILEDNEDLNIIRKL
tara:strand:+ start:4568 stop:4981 length:414 start_codon:yes stop_codon:yes gene_type:complete